MGSQNRRSELEEKYNQLLDKFKNLETRRTAEERVFTQIIHEKTVEIDALRTRIESLLSKSKNNHKNRNVYNKNNGKHHTRRAATEMDDLPV